MDWYEKLYVGTTAEKKKDRLIQKIENGKTPVNTYLITLPKTEKNQMEILPVWNLRFWYPLQTCPLIIGLACGREEATEVVCRITKDILAETGDCRIRDYFECSTGNTTHSNINRE